MYRTVSWTLWEREGGMIWENGIETCIISYEKQIASPGSMQDTGCLGLVHWDDHLERKERTLLCSRVTGGD